MYVQYRQYILKSYTDTLRDVSTLVQRDYPLLNDGTALIREAEARSDEYWGTVRHLAQIQESFSLAYIYVLEQTPGGYRFLLDTDDLDEENPGEALFKLYEEVPPEAIDALNTGVPRFSEPYTDEYGTFVSFFTPLRQAGKSAMLLGVDYDISTINAFTLRARIAFLAALGISVLITGAFALFVAAQVVRPIRSNIQVLQTIAEGDLTTTIDERGQDELSDMTRLLGSAQSSVAALIQAIRDQARGLSGIGEDLSSMATQSAGSVTEISGAIESIKKQTGFQKGSVTKTGSLLTQVASKIENLHQKIADQSGMISRSSATIEGMLSRLEALTCRVTGNAGEVEELKALADAGRTGLEGVLGNISQISRESAGLLDITDVLSTIAAQTNLLSMNAAIEAAHAGEAGKGFAVVASEIRKLAESSAQQSTAIAETLKRVKNRIDAISLSASAVMERFEAIEARINLVADQEGEIRSSLEEQEVGSREVLECLGSLKTISGEITTGSQEIQSGSGGILQESRQLENLSNEIDGAMDLISSEADQISGAVHRVNDISSQNRESIHVLMKEISRFKVAG